MKSIQTIIVATALLSPAFMRAAEPAGPAANPESPAGAAKVAVTSPEVNSPKPKEEATKPAERADASVVPYAGNGTNGLRMNFRGASLEMVLSHLSEAAGFIINVKPGVSVRGKVDVWSNDTLTREEALDLLDTVLIQNGLAAIRNGKVLSIVNRDEAKTQNIPVFQEADPQKIPATDRIVTQIIPVRFVEAAQLIKDLQPLLSAQTSITANEAGNSLVLTDTQANIKKVAEVVRAIDMGAEDPGVVKVFHLQHADPTETADLLTNLFPDDSRTGGSQGSQFAGRFGGGIGRLFGGFGGGGGGGGFGGGAGGGANAGSSGAQNQRLRKRNRVVAVADPRTSSVVVTATRDLMDQIEGVIQELDPDAANTQDVAIYHMQNAQPQEALQVLTDIFNKNGTQNNRNNSANQNSPLNNRSTTQNQQNNTGSRTTLGTSNARGGGGGMSFGQ